MGIRVLEAGLYTTVQDAGRSGYRRWGIGRGGALDGLAASLLNILLGNPPEAALLEMHFPAPRLRFEQAAVIAIGGADFDPTLDGRPLANWQRHAVQPGQQLAFRQPRRGRWAYLGRRRRPAYAPLAGQRQHEPFCRAGGASWAATARRR